MKWIDYMCYGIQLGLKTIKEEDINALIFFILGINKMNLIPKISIVVVNLNLAEYIEDCLLSIINQNYDNLELIVVDGQSTDGSISIIEKHKVHISKLIIEKDNGAYFAVEKGLQNCSGDIMAWISSDDMYLPHSFKAVAQIFNQYPDIDWLMGQSKEFNQRGSLIGRIGMNWSRWSRKRILSNDYQFIQQESCFWRRNLWNEAGGVIDTQYKYAADLALWTRFFRYSKLHTTTAELAGFRHRDKEQRSKKHLKEYLTEASLIIRQEKKSLNFLERLEIIFLKLMRWVFGPFFFLDIPFFNKIYPAIFKIPTLINYDFDEQQFVRNNTLVKHPAMLFGKRQIHKKALGLK